MGFYAPTVTADQYIRGVLQQRSRFVSDATIQNAFNIIIPHIRAWGGSYISEISVSGSYAKKTAIGAGSDIDLFVSLIPETPDTLQQIHQTLLTRFQQAGLLPRKQNVSIGLTVANLKVDVVPAKRQNNQGNDHSLCLSKVNSWRKTNVAQHISYISGSGRTEEIRALKCWRDCHGLEFPTFNIELAVINALNGKPYGQLASNMATVLQYLTGNFLLARLVDPANSANIVSNDMTQLEKQAVARVAKQSLQAQNWNQVIW